MHKTRAENNDNNGQRTCRKPRPGLVSLGRSRSSSYWRSLQELTEEPLSSGEFPGGLPSRSASDVEGAADFTRRDFLSLVGFSLGVASATACRAPVEHAVPLAAGSDQLVPGVSNYYATTCGGCSAACSLLVKQRDGRPIKVEGNADSPLFGGGTCATGQATVLSLYDDARLRGPVWEGKPTSWSEVDRFVTEALAAAQGQNGKIALMTGTITSPSTLAIITAFGRKYPNFQHVVYDATSASALRAAQEQSFGKEVTPHFRFDKARVIVAIEADFLGTWLSPVEFARQYAIGRKPGPRRSFHVQFESGLSITGTNADVRVPVAPSELGLAAAALLIRIARRSGVEYPELVTEPFDAQRLDDIADHLWNNRGESLVVTASQDVSVQNATAALNSMLGNIDTTVSLARPSMQRQGSDRAVAELVDDMHAGRVHTLLLLGVNPGYDFPDASRFISGMQKVALTVSLSDRNDETSIHAKAICPDHHFLEAWGDSEPVVGHYTLAQPIIAPLFNTRSAAESLLRWLGNETDHLSYLRGHWREKIFLRCGEQLSFDEFWDRSLQTGTVELPVTAIASQQTPVFLGDWKLITETLASEHERGTAKLASGITNYELHLYESVALRDGRHANNPWLQELPDPITKITWGNFATVAPSAAKALGLHDGDVVAITTDRGKIELPVCIQPGQHRRTVSVALGYGRQKVGKAGQNVGVNAYPLTSTVDAHRQYWALAATLTTTGRNEPVASTQTQFSMQGRPIVLETTALELEAVGKAKRPEQGDIGEPHRRKTLPTLWPERLKGAHSWGMAVDLNACTGCSACVIACQAENNVPVVGKDQVQRARIMHWIRIDQYYTGDVDNPSSLHQPMMCQHCGHAPCETVCPVVATTTSSEGLNQQVYNRCIGTRYCANNCPYKVRRFNWYNYTQSKTFDFNMSSPLGRMVLNPDVAVRSRGVMEKCSLCVQRIQSAKNTALKERRTLIDGDIQTACQQACPTGAIVFGDLKDPHSRVSRQLESARAYRVLEDLGTRPNVGYLKKLRHTTET